MKKKMLFILLGTIVFIGIIGILLWNRTKKSDDKRFLATVLEIQDTTVTVKPMEFEAEYKSSDAITFTTENLSFLEIEVGDIIEIIYEGAIQETYPATVQVVEWNIPKDFRPMKFEEEWINWDIAIKDETTSFNHVTIETVYADCFFVRQSSGGELVKINGKLGSRWCVGDLVKVICKNGHLDMENRRSEYDMVRVKASENISTIETPDAKPVIYLYPEKETEVSVQLDYKGELTCTYPNYQSGWKVQAFPDGTLIDASGKSYNYLYWEGNSDVKYDFSKGFCVKGEDTAEFLEEALEKLGLTRREANEFIVYWLPMMEPNPYNVISFQTDVYTNHAKLKINPEPDTLIRVFMAWEASDSYKRIEEQELSAPEREGFTVVEWGGSQK